MNHSNKDRKSLAEGEEGRPSIKENTGQPHTYLTQRGKGVPEGLSAAISAGASRVASGLLCVHAVAITPAGSAELVRSSVSIASGLPPDKAGSAPAIIFYGACSAFLHVTVCSLAESPNNID